MSIFTVSFFGHRRIDDAIRVESGLEKKLRRLICEREYIEFLVGRDGEFDLMVASVVRRVTRSTGWGNTHLTLVLPYLKAEYRDHEQEYLAYFDEVEVCPVSAAAHPKSAIRIRNREMVERSDLVICCIQHEYGGAYQAVQYAEKQGKKVMNLADEEEVPD